MMGRDRFSVQFYARITKTSFYERDEDEDRRRDEDEDRRCDEDEDEDEDDDRRRDDARRTGLDVDGGGVDSISESM